VGGLELSYFVGVELWFDISILKTGLMALEDPGLFIIFLPFSIPLAAFFVMVLMILNLFVDPFFFEQVELTPLSLLLLL